MAYKPIDPQFEARVRESFSRQRVMDTFGADLTEVSPGHVVISLPFNPDLTQQHGFLHAGVVTTLLDSACGYAAFSLMPADAAVLSVEFKINLLAPAAGTELRATADVVRPGRTLTVCHADGWMNSDKGPVHVATMQATMIALASTEGRQG